MYSQSNKFVCLLKAINVGGRNKIAMKELCASLEKIGYSDIQYYLQSGNLVFTCTDSDINQISSDITKIIEKDFGLNIEIILLSHEEFLYLAGETKFNDIENYDSKNAYFTFFKNNVIKDINSIVLPKADDEYCIIESKAAYIYCPGGYGNTKLNNNTIEKKLGVVATTRNWNTINAIKNLLNEK